MSYLRGVRCDDIAALQVTNIENLAENYTDKFYLLHLLGSSECSVICESAAGDGQWGGEGAVIPAGGVSAYVMARGEGTGAHVTSLAANSGARGGLAGRLMALGHARMRAAARPAKVNLHVRLTNHAAYRLYRGMNYKILSLHRQYYGDQEHAFEMELDMKR